MRNVTLSLLAALALMLPAACDNSRSHTWKLTGDGLVLHKPGTREPIRISLPDWLWVGEPYGCGPALAVGPSGEAVVTSDVVPTLWRVDPRSLQVSQHPLALDRHTDKDVGFSALIYSREQDGFIAVSGIQGSLWKIDAPLTKAEAIGTPDSQTARILALRHQAQICTPRFVAFSLDN